VTLLDGLVAHWKLDEESGDRLDSSGNGHTLTPDGDVTTGAGKLGLAVAQGSFTVPNTFDVPDGFTVGVWVKDAGISDYPGSTVAVYISGEGGDDVCSLSFGHSLRAHFDIAGADLSYPEVVSEALTADEWHLLVAWWEPGAGLYLQTDNAEPMLTAFTGENVTNDQEIPAGVIVDGTGQAVDSVSFWSRVLTSDERTRLWNNGDGLDYPFTLPVPKGGAGSSMLMTPARLPRMTGNRWTARHVGPRTRNSF